MPDDIRQPYVTLKPVYISVNLCTYMSVSRVSLIIKSFWLQELFFLFSLSYNIKRREHYRITKFLLSCKNNEITSSVAKILFERVEIFKVIYFNRF